MSKKSNDDKPSKKLIKKKVVSDENVHVNDVKLTKKLFGKINDETEKPTKKIVKKKVDTQEKDEHEKPVKKLVNGQEKDERRKTVDDSNFVDVDNIKIVKRKKDGQYILVIVESPGKIKKLESILGTGYKVTSSFGHIMDLHSKKISVDIDNGFKPEYHILTGEGFSNKKKVVADLRKLASNASKVIIASDHDREGEMIGWSYKMVLGLHDDDYERITFNSITKEEVKKAIKNPSKIDMKMVDSQKTRRILDRIVGFKISPSLSQLMGTTKLSAGRVQSIVVKLICEKEQEINNFFEGDNASFFKIVGDFSTSNIDNLKCDLFSVNDKLIDNEERDENDDDKKDEEKGRAKIKSYKIAQKLMNSIVDSKFKIANVIVKKSKRYPSPPYTTSTIQQDASTKLGFNVKRTMTALQKLYEGGYTTYLRTDSTNLSNDALMQCTEYIKAVYGKKYHQYKNYTNSKGNTQEAHEAIRPVKIDVESVDIGQDEKKIYQLVWNRTVASQMTPAEVDVYNINISISNENDYVFKTSIEDITYDGYLAIYGINNKNMIIVPKVGDKIIADNIKCSEEYKKPPLRYSEAGLIKKMDPKNLNIGRPATYAEVINTIQKRNYVEIKDIEGFEKESRILLWCSNDGEITTDKKIIHIGREKKKFSPTVLGTQVNNILNKHFPDVMNYQFTAHMETELDDIAEGTKEWVECLDDFWNTLKPELESLHSDSKFQKVLGQHPETGYDVIATVGHFGPMLTMARSSKKCENATAPIKEPYKLETITLKEALKILEYPKILGKHNKKNVEIKKGMYGYYISYNSVNINIPDDIKPKNITLDKAIELIDEKDKHEEDKVNNYLMYKKDGSIEYIINKGKFGENNKYLMVRDTSNKKLKPKFVSLNDSLDVSSITLEKLKELASQKKKVFVNYAKKKK